MISNFVGKIFNKICDWTINSKKYPVFYEKLIDRIFSSEKGYKKIIDRVIQSNRHFDAALEMTIESENGFSRLNELIGKDSGVGTRNETAREAWLEKALKEIPAGLKILDAGAGELKYKKFCGHLDYVSQDFGQYDGKGNRVGLQIGNWDNSKLDIVSDITKIPVEDKSFDAIMCIEVFEHLPEPAKAVKEFSRILRKNGILIITAPFCSITHFAPYHFANGYSKYWYEKILAENGFETSEITPNGNYFEYVAQETRRIPEIAREFSGDVIKKTEVLSSKVMLKLLDRLSKKDTGSDSLLNFGYHVRAVKL